MRPSNTWIGFALWGVYTFVSTLAYPLGRLWIHRRLRRGKEDPAFLKERFGCPSRERPQGPLLWIHCASVGEAMGVLGLVEDLLESRPSWTILLTTGTVTSARLLRKRFHPNSRVLHQMAPLDWVWCVWRFLTFWRPQGALIMEADLWPQMLGTLQHQKIPTFLINSQLSRKTYGRWRFLRPLFGFCTRGVERVFAVSQPQARLLRALGMAQVEVAGSLKWTTPPLPVVPETLARYQSLVAARRVLVAASTHPGEETFLLAVFKKLQKSHPSLLLVLVPRHPDRAPGVQTEAQEAGFQVVLDSVQRHTSVLQGEVLVVDAMGVLGLFYRLADVAFVGGSLFPPMGGHNLVEPLLCGTPVLHGPYMGKQQEVMDHLDHLNITQKVSTVSACVQGVRHWLEDESSRQQAIAAGLQEVEKQRQKVLGLYRKGLEDLAEKERS